jgi:hypothetical protein
VRDVPEFFWSIVAVGSSLGVVEDVADIPLTLVRHAIVSPTTMRP